MSIKLHTAINDMPVQKSDRQPAIISSVASISVKNSLNHLRPFKIDDLDMGNCLSFLFRDNPSC
ncbi:hypothetical protein CKA32_003425 [Geitlerinema sp. FC II]|nr:hypothetical protein CKA32_003425 [Geitlerinema sp. FC II]